jgi:hypothetical protein
MPAKQVHMSIYDINPTESFWDKVDDRPLYKEDARLWLKQELIDDIRAHGIKYQLNVDPYGNIKNGNMRYWVARYLLEKEKDERFRFLPVQRNYAAGAFYKEFQFVVKDIPGQPKITQEEVDDVGEKLAIDIHKQWCNQTRELTIPSRSTFDTFEIDPIDEFRMTNFWDQQRNMWAVFMQPHPKHKQNMVCFGISGEPHEVDILKTGTPAERKAFKRWWKNIREKRQLIGSTRAKAY